MKGLSLGFGFTASRSALVGVVVVDKRIAGALGSG